MRPFVLASGCALLCHAAPPGLPQEFQDWAKTYGKRYTTAAEWERAMTNYNANAELIAKLRDEQDSAKYAHNEFSDLTPADFKVRLLPNPLDVTRGRQGAAPVPDIEATDMPDSVDWRQEGAVTPVRNQGSCGSCWAHSAVGNMESLWYLANKGSMSKPVPLSVEQVVECDAHDDACYGGYMKGGFEYAIEHGGLSSEADYPTPKGTFTICLANQTFNQTCGDGMCDDPPLTSYCDMKCSDTRHKAVAKFSSWVALPSDEDKIAAYLAQHGPVSAGIDAAGKFLGVLLPWLQFYHSGVASPRGCRGDTSHSIDHGVLLVGYGEDKGKKYWTVKNSWGDKWGEKGFFRLLRGSGTCAINLMTGSAVVDKAALPVLPAAPGTVVV